MRKKGNQAAKQLKAYYAQLPVWYWKRGLHDADILSISELELVSNYKEEKPKYNCLEIALDCKNAMFEDNIEKIRLYNYKIKTPGVDINNIAKPWWISDTIQQLDNQKYLLTIEIESAQSDRTKLIIEFGIPEVIRN